MKKYRYIGIAYETIPLETDFYDQTQYSILILVQEENHARKRRIETLHQDENGNENQSLHR